MKTFLICPVRGVSIEDTRDIVDGLERTGWTVHWPPRDTPQNDITGLEICKTNRMAIEGADAVHVVWDGKSQGCLFDLGMAFMMRKPLHLIQIPDASEGKSFQNMMRAWSDENRLA